jgi:hypothetical protein
MRCKNESTQNQQNEQEGQNNLVILNTVAILLKRQLQGVQEEISDLEEQQTRTEPTTGTRSPVARIAAHKVEPSSANAGLFHHGNGNEIRYD